MKSVFKLALLLCLLRQETLSGQSCCLPQSQADFQGLADNRAFRNAHDEPLPFRFTTAAGGEMITFGTPDGKTANGFYLKAKGKSKRYLFVYQEWWGLNDYIKQEAEKWYNEFGGNVNVLAIDMYDGKVATTRDDAAKYMKAAEEPRLNQIVQGAINFAGKRARIASIGWCFGGGWSLKSALLEGKQAAGCVMYYGMPVKDTAQLKKLQTDVLGLFAGREKWINKDVVAEFEKNMQLVGKGIQTKIFDAEHAFANPSNPNFDKTATDEAFKLASEYLKSRLK
jgi:carboxymethylenebutenolidase